MRWIKSHKLIATILALVIVLGTVFIVSISGDSQGNKVTDGVTTANGVVTGFFGDVTKSIKDGLNGIIRHKDLMNQIDALEEEKAQLERELAEAKLESEQLKELKDLSGILKYDYVKATFNVVSCDVELKDGSKWQEEININRGTESGITEGKIVISGAGLVGKVTDSGEGWAKVITIIQDGSNISFSLARDGKQLGIAKGTGDGKIEGYMLENGSTVAEGDVLITSGMGSFPAGLEIGVVKSVRYNSDLLLTEVEIEPSVKIAELRKVAVIQ